MKTEMGTDIFLTFSFVMMSLKLTAEHSTHHLLGLVFVVPTHRKCKQSKQEIRGK